MLTCLVLWHLGMILIIAAGTRSGTLLSDGGKLLAAVGFYGSWWLIPVTLVLSCAIHFGSYFGSSRRPFDCYGPTLALLAPVIMLAESFLAAELGFR